MSGALIAVLAVLVAACARKDRDGGGGEAMTEMPGESYAGQLPPLTAQEKELLRGLRAHVDALATDIGERNIRGDYEALQAAAAYIERALTDLGYEVRSQDFEADGKMVPNLEVELPGTGVGDVADEIIVVGAHYDSASDCPAANDNGTGVAALLEIARLMKGSPQPRTVRFVAFVNEEPPYFLSDEMGSLVYAKRCAERRERVVGMVSLETIGYYSDEAGSQNYPAPFDQFYPDTGNFIAFVGNLKSKQLVHDAIGSFRRHTQFPSEGIAAPDLVHGVGWSDHWSFWQVGYPALMVTDTAPFRYPHYHKPTDTPDKIDFERTARVVAGMARVITELAGGKVEGE